MIVVAMMMMIVMMMMIFSLWRCLGAITAPAEKKQLVVVSAAYDVLMKMVRRDELSPEVLQKVGFLVDCLSARNFAGANQVQTVSDGWIDWLLVGLVGWMDGWMDGWIDR